MHLSSAHPRHDIRIFTKQCRSLAAHGYEVSLVVADGKGDARCDGVQILDAGHSGGRWRRIAAAPWRVAARARALQADLYHLHDPELLPAGLVLKHGGARVVFDAHEDVTLQLLSKPYLAPALRPLVAGAYLRLEQAAARRFDGIVGATPPIAARFAALNPNTACVCNFPLLAEFPHPAAGPSGRNVCYLGDISLLRGAREMVRAMGLLSGPARLNLAGAGPAPALLEALRREPGWARVNALGLVDRHGVAQVLARSCAGLVTLQPAPNYLESLPIKMFEYMAAGLPVIASDFPAWRRIIEGHRCGLCVDPRDPSAIAAAIDALAADPARAAALGANGRRAVLAHFHWERELPRLLALYARLLGPRALPPSSTSTHAGSPTPSC